MIKKHFLKTVVVAAIVLLLGAVYIWNFINDSGIPRSYKECTSYPNTTVEVSSNGSKDLFCSYVVYETMSGMGGLYEPYESGGINKENFDKCVEIGGYTGTVGFGSEKYCTLGFQNPDFVFPKSYDQCVLNRGRSRDSYFTVERCTEAVGLNPYAQYFDKIGLKKQLEDCNEQYRKVYKKDNSAEGYCSVTFYVLDPESKEFLKNKCLERGSNQNFSQEDAAFICDWAMK